MNSPEGQVSVRSKFILPYRKCPVSIRIRGESAKVVPLTSNGEGSHAGPSIKKPGWFVDNLPLDELRRLIHNL